MVRGGGDARLGGTYGHPMLTGVLLAALASGLLAVIAAVAGVAGTLSEQTAPQRRQATQVTPIIVVIELVVPLLLAVTIGGESWGSNALSLCSIIAGTGLLIASVLALMQTPAARRR
jgi:hypothetical protein